MVIGDNSGRACVFIALCYFTLASLIGADSGRVSLTLVKRSSFYIPEIWRFSYELVKKHNYNKQRIGKGHDYPKLRESRKHLSKFSLGDYRKQFWNTMTQMSLLAIFTEVRHSCRSGFFYGRVGLLKLTLFLYSFIAYIHWRCIPKIIHCTITDGPRALAIMVALIAFLVYFSVRNCDRSNFTGYRAIVKCPGRQNVENVHNDSAFCFLDLLRLSYLRLQQFHCQWSNSKMSGRLLPQK